MSDDDIVARLRGFDALKLDAWAICDDAADEITRLRDDLAAADDAVWKISDLQHDLCDMRLRAEAAEARERKAKELLKEARWSVQHCRLLKLLARIDALKGDASE